jgi:hypothetical protein
MRDRMYHLLTHFQDWPMWWRILILLNISFYNMMGNVFAAGISPLFGLLIEEFHCSVDQASRLATYALLMLGLSVSALIIYPYRPIVI